MNSHTPWLMGRATGIMLVAVVAGLISAQWKHEALPLAALAIVLGLTVLKSYWVIMDFMGLRGVRPRLGVALIAWVGLFVIAVMAKAVIVFAE